jgi:phage terminase large subunit
MSIKATWLLGATIEAFEQGYVGVLHEGGSRSSKTKSIVQFICLDILKNKNKGLVYTLARDWRTNLDRTIWRDIKWALGQFGMLTRASINSQKYTIEVAGNLIQGIGINDDPMLVFGLEHYFFWTNEANGTVKEAFEQMKMRTSGMWCLDYNPKDLEHWCYDLELRQDVKVFRSTILDNPFVPDAMRQEIMSYDPSNPRNVEQRTADAFKWKVYGLGQRGTSEETIFKNLLYYSDEEEPERSSCEWCYYGGDFGYVAPSVLVQVKKKGINLYLKTVFYEAGLTNQQIAERLRKDYGKELQVWDSAEQKSILELRNAGINAWPADKGEGSVYQGLQLLKNFNLYLHKDSKEMVKEFQGAKWKTDKAGNLMKDSQNRPIHADTNAFHCLAAVRYVVTKFLR